MNTEDVVAEPVAAEPAIPAVDPTAPAAIEPAPTEPDATEPEPAVQRQRANDPLISTITGLRGRNRELEERATRAERLAAEAQALVERLAAPPSGNGAAAPPSAPAQLPEADIDRLAEYKLFQRDVGAMRESGLKQFGPAFIDSIRVLEAVGATDDNFVAQVMAVDRGNAHGLLNQIAQNPEMAVSLVGMAPARRIAELTRMAMAATATTEPAAAPKAAPALVGKTVSKAPAPPPVIQPSASKVVDWRSDDASDDDFTAGFNEMMKTRMARR